MIFRVIAFFSTLLISANTVYANPRNADQLQSFRSFLTIEILNGKEIYFEIPDSILNREILVFTRILDCTSDLSQVVLRTSSNRGVKTLEVMFRFVKVSANHIDLEIIPYNFHTASDIFSDSDSKSLFVKYSFEIKSPDHNKNVSKIDVTSLFKDDNNFIFINKSKKSQLQLDSKIFQAVDVGKIVPFQSHFEIESTLHYSKGIWLHLNTSVLLLPKDSMRARLANSRIGYFTQKVLSSIETMPAKSEEVVITRWRLEPKPGSFEGHEKYFTPVKPIIFYLDPSIPKNWKPYVMKAINDWGNAFRRAGFRNAVMAKLPEDENMQDSFRFDAFTSVIHFLASGIKEGTFSSVVDPRTGQIIQSHILLTTGFIEYLKTLYFIQVSPTDPMAREYPMNEKLVGELIRGIVSHEIGHALGLDHNMIANYSTPVKKLRNNKWLLKRGCHTVSIMDYARYNYVAQPEDGVKPVGLLSHIGPNDEWSIEWGYGFVNAQSIENEAAELDEVINRKSEDKRYWYSNGLSNDPRTIPELVGNDNIKSSQYGILNLKYIISNLKHWPLFDSISSDSVRNLYYSLTDQYRLYMQHVLAYINSDYSGTSFGKLGPVPKRLQKKAIQFISKEMMHTPHWLLDANLGICLNEMKTIVSNLQNNILNQLLVPTFLAGFMPSDRRHLNRSYALVDYLKDLEKGLFGKKYSFKNVDSLIQRIQVNYVRQLKLVIASETPNKVKDVIKSRMVIMASKVKRLSTNRPTKPDHIALLIKELSQSSPEQN